MDNTIDFDEFKRWQKDKAKANGKEPVALDELAGMSLEDWGRNRTRIHENTGIPLSMLDTEYKRRNAKKAEGPLLIHWGEEPWPHPVDARRLIEQIEQRIKRHVVLSDDAILTAALWVAFAWVHDAAVHSPILLVSSPEAECGKSTLLGLVGFLVRRGLTAVEISPAVLYRLIEKWRPTMIVDEADVAFKGNPELRAVINAGWTRGTGVPRCNPVTHEPELFDTFGPKAIGLKGLKVPDTTLSRSIIIDMQRKLPGDKAEGFDHIDDDELCSLRRQLLRFADDNLERLRSASPLLPDGFANRIANNWKVMLAIAELGGKTLAERARDAARTLSRRADDANLGVELLRDIRDLFVGLDRIRSEDLVNKLVAMVDRPWPEMPYNGKSITQPQVARLLKPYGVKPDQVRFGELTFKGFKLEWFKDAFRYIPSNPPEGETPKQRRKSAVSGETSTETREQDVSAKTAEISQYTVLESAV
jgi:putative DNA primase/helicase